MGWKNYYAMGLQAPGYSKRAIHTKWGDIFVGATASDLQADAQARALKAQRFYGIAYGKADGAPLEVMMDPTPQQATKDLSVIDDLIKVSASKPEAVIARWFGDKGDHPNDFSYVAYFDKQDPSWPSPVGEFGNKILTAPVIVPVKAGPSPSTPSPASPASHGIAKAGLAIAGALGIIGLMAKH